MSLRNSFLGKLLKKNVALYFPRKYSILAQNNNNEFYVNTQYNTKNILRCNYCFFFGRELLFISFLLDKVLASSFPHDILFATRYCLDGQLVLGLLDCLKILSFLILRRPHFIRSIWFTQFRNLEWSLVPLWRIIMNVHI